MSRQEAYRRRAKPEPIVTFNEESLKSDLHELVRRTVKDTLNGPLEEEAGI